MEIIEKSNRDLEKNEGVVIGYFRCKYIDIVRNGRR